MALGGQEKDCENVEADMIVPDDGFQIRHKEFGLFQGSCMGMGFWYPMSEMPEQGICKFPAYEDARKYITFLCLDADCPLRHGDLTIEPFDAELNIRLMKVGRLKNIDYCQNENVEADMISKVHFSSQRGDWKTPKALYQALDAEFGFDCDPCPVHPVEDGLKSEWGQVSFVNPPYGRKIGLWIEKAYAEAKKGKTVVLLIPSRTDTKWWHDYCMKADEIRFIRGRLYFDDGEGRAPFPSAVVIFRG